MIGVDSFTSYNGHVDNFTKIWSVEEKTDRIGLTFGSPVIRTVTKG